MIRKVKLTDIDKILEIENNSFLLGRYNKDQLLYELNENPFTTFLCYEEDNIIKGFIIYMITFNTSSVIQIAVDNKYRGLGIGSNLIKEMINRLLSLGYGEIETITLELRENNTSAHNLYLKHKFNDVCIKSKYYENGDNAIYMVRSLL